MPLTNYYIPSYRSSFSNANDVNLSEDSSVPQSHIALTDNVVPNQDPLDFLLTGRLSIVEGAIAQVREEIEGREKLRDTLLLEIDYALCVQKTLLHQAAPNGSSVFTVGDPRRRAAIEREISSLEAEQRSEKSSAWKDIASLTRELRELLREKAEEMGRQKALEP